MKAVVLGADGKVGRALATRFPDATVLTRRELDLAQDCALREFPGWAGHDTLINAAAWTAVDDAETAGGRFAAWRTNATAVAHLAEIANAHRMTLVHFSSDYVFNGAEPGPISHEAAYRPLNVYGRTKLAGDLAAMLADRHLVVRTSWVFGDGRNFVRNMLELATRSPHDVIRCVADQWGRPTFADDLVDGVAALVDAGAEPGEYHLTNSGLATTWAGLARRTMELAGLSAGRIEDKKAASCARERPGTAARPPNSELALDRAARYGVVLPDWRDGLARYVARELSRTAAP